MTAPKLANLVLISNHKNLNISLFIFVHQISSNWQHQYYQPSYSKINYLSLFESIMVYLVNLNIHRFIDIFVFTDYQANDSTKTSSYGLN
jgi:hypothetical protein